MGEWSGHGRRILSLDLPRSRCPPLPSPTWPSSRCTSPTAAARALESKFVEEVRRREASIQRKTAWKTKGTGARFMGAEARGTSRAGAGAGVFHVRVSRPARDEILYALTTGVVSGIFAHDLATGTETRLVHGTEGDPLDLATSDEHAVLAFARRHKNGSCNLAVMRDDGGDVALVTDGDTVDGGPSWVPAGRDAKDGRHQLVYASSGIGRDPAGVVAGFGPTEILLLDAERGDLETLVTHPEHDYLAPRMMQDGSLFAMRRPYHRGPPAPTAAGTLKDGLLAPFRLMYAGFRYLDFFSMKYSGKPLTTTGDTKGRRVDARRLLERQNVAGSGDEEAQEAAMRAPPRVGAGEADAGRRRDGGRARRGGVRRRPRRDGAADRRRVNRLHRRDGPADPRREGEARDRARRNRVATSRTILCPGEAALSSTATLTRVPGASSADVRQVEDEPPGEHVVGADDELRGVAARPLLAHGLGPERHVRARRGP